MVNVLCYSDVEQFIISLIPHPHVILTLCVTLVPVYVFVCYY